MLFEGNNFTPFTNQYKAYVNTPLKCHLRMRIVPEISDARINAVVVEYTSANSKM